MNLKIATSPNIIVSNNQLSFNGLVFRCAIGKSGISDNKQEGDGATPRGVFRLRECWYRADRIKSIKTGLPLRVTYEEDGWCDEPSSPHYNRPVKLPYSLSHEKMWREDHVYDIVVPLGYNDDPVIPGKGSAIFMHLARPALAAPERNNEINYEPTEGCVALAQPDLLALLALCDTNSCIEIA